MRYNRPDTIAVMNDVTRDPRDGPWHTPVNPPEQRLLDRHLWRCSDIWPVARFRTAEFKRNNKIPAVVTIDTGDALLLTKVKSRNRFRFGRINFTICDNLREITRWTKPGMCIALEHRRESTRDGQTWVTLSSDEIGLIYGLEKLTKHAELTRSRRPEMGMQSEKMALKFSFIFI